MAKLTVDYPNMPKGEPVEVPGLGLFPNGSTQEVEKEDVAVWERVTGMKFPSGGVLELPQVSKAKTKTPQPVEQKPSVPATDEDDNEGDS